MLFTGSPAPQVNVHLVELEPEEAGPSHGTYIIPVTDITIETSSGSALDAVRYEYLFIPEITVKHNEYKT